MDDSCAVCAETLEWVAYGPCGHREVCSTCVARLRFICDDRRCCICKTESDVVFVTKALGDYTRVISDFSVLPSERREGRVGSYWYHEDTQSLFDDLDHYKMIKAMCRLSCSVCDKMEENPNDGSKRRARFRNIEQLKGHLFHQHRLLMCSLCLEGRKVFICEQKLYTRAQLNQHISTGDSEVDGTERERGGFMGHPMCEFCRTPFYGDNELYSHMSTDHYTCHICQRQHPGQYEYYKNYDDLEIHFGREHFLCEDEACLAKKFVVFQSESEMKRHNAMEHGGHMSRSQRNAALQIPTSFRYRQSNEHDNRRGRGRTFRRDYSGDQLSMAIEASFEMANEDGTFHGPSSSSTQIVSDHGVTSNIDPIVQPFESLATTDSEPPSRYRQALSQNSSNAPLEESSFPPLPLAPSSSQQKSKHLPGGLPRNTMAVQISRNVPLEGSSFPPFPLAPSSSRAKAKHEPEGLSRNTMAAQKSRNAPPEGSSFPPLPLATSSSQPKAKHEPEGLPRNTMAAQKSKNAPLEESSFPPLPLAPSSSQQKSKHEPEGLPRNAMAVHLRHQNNRNVTLPNAAQAWSAASRAPVLPATGPIYTRPIANGAPGLSSSSGRNKSATDNGPEPSTYSSLVQVQPSSVHEPSPDGTSNSSREMSRTSRISHSTSAPNLAHSASFDPSTANFPPVSATQTRKLPSSASTGQDTLKVEDVHTANKSLVERIRSALEFDEAKYNAFKEISGEYRLGSLDAGSYLAYVEQFGLSHLVIELARLCPDAEKQTALLEAYNATLNSNTSQENGWSKGRTHIKDSSGCKKGKGKCLDAEGNSSKDNLTESILSTVRKLQSTYRPSEEDVEVLSRDGYRSAQAEMSSSSQSSLKLKGENNSHSAGDGSNKKVEDSGGKSKQRKKTSKFHRVRLGDGSVAALLDPNSTDPDTDPYSDAKEATSDANKNPIEGLPVRGAWRQGGGQRLLGMTARDPQK